MPFDELRRRALEALDGRRQAYHSAVATAVDEVRALLETQRAPQNGRGHRTAAELGQFASGRIDPERFASLFSEQDRLEPDAVDRIQAALDTLTGLMAEGDALHTLRVPAGSDLRDAVRGALARAGRAFGAGRAVENARTGARAADYGDGFDPSLWNRAERAIAPPLVVEVDGADLRPAGLTDLLEGRQALVLLVRRPAPPAALARLIAPGTLVVQGTDAAALDALKVWDGPAVVAVVPEGAAVFSYRPVAGGPGELELSSMPADGLRPLTNLSVARQESDLELLRLLDGAMAGRVVAAAAAGGAEPEPDPADKLAAWLLRQAIIPEPGEV
jgi:hypothetical protein